MRREVMKMGAQSFRQYIRWLPLAPVLAFALSLPGDQHPERDSNRAPSGKYYMLDSSLPALNIPNSCILDVAGRGTKKNAAYARHSNFAQILANENTLSETYGYAPRVYFISSKCTGYLDSYSRDALRFRYLDGKKKAMFSYIPSRKRPYCGTTPIETSCENDFYRDTQVLVRIDTPHFPEELNDILRPLQEHSRTRLGFAAANAVEFYAVPRVSSPLGLNAFAISGSGGKKNIARSGGVRYVRIASHADPHTKDYDRKTINALVYTTLNDIAEVWQNTNKDHWFYKNRDGFTLMRHILERARVLRSYWANSKTLLQSHDPGSPRLERGIMNFNNSEPSPFKYSGEELRKRDIFELVQRMTNSVIDMAAHRITHAQNAEQLLDAASFWWAARGTQIHMGCDEEKDVPIIGARKLVELQYMYQTCRRHYTNRAYLSLNRTIDRNGKLELGSMAWTVAIALGSRRERIDLYTSALDILEKQIRQGRHPNDHELSLVAHEIRQAVEEKQHGQVLTWNGLQNASTVDHERLDRFLARATQFMSDLRQYVDARRLEHPSFYLRSKKTWDLVRAQLKLDEWRVENEDTEISHHTLIAGAPEIEALQTSLASVKNLATKHRKFLRDLHTTSIDTLERVPALDSELCSNWLEWLADVRSASPSSRLRLRVKNTDQLRYCMDVVPYWLVSADIETTSRPSQLDAQCEQGHGLSCLTHYLLSRGRNQQYTSEQWQRLLTTEPYRLSVARTLFKEFRASYDAGMKGSRRSERRAWIQARKAAGITLKQWLQNQMSPLPPEVSAFKECISYKDWFKLLKSYPVKRTASRLTAKDSCSEADRESTLLWAERTAILRKMGGESDPGELWEENVASAAARLIIWHDTMLPHSKAELNKRPRLTEAEIEHFESSVKIYLERPPTIRDSSLFWQSSGDFMRMNSIRHQISELLRAWKRCQERRGTRCTHIPFDRIMHLL